MVCQEHNCTNSKESETIAVTNNPAPDDENVPPEERREQVLEFLDEHDMPLPPLAIYGGLYRQYRITFSYRTIQNIVSDLVEDGYAFRVDTKKLQEGEIVPVENGGSRRSYYFITDKGRGRLDNSERE